MSDASVTGEAELVNTLPTTLLPEADTAVQLGWSLEGGGPESAALTLITDAPELDDAVVVYANSGDDACGVDRDGDGLSAEQGDCDGADNDCDGLIDEGDDGAAGSACAALE